MTGDENTFATRASLLLRLRRTGSPREVAWNEFFERYAPVIRGFARKMGVAAHEIDDLVQSVMLGFFSASASFHYDPQAGRFRGYLKTCVCRVLRRQLSKRRAPDGRAFASISDDDVWGEEDWNEIWNRELLRRANETVRMQCQGSPDQERTYRAFSLAVELGRSTAEIASELQMSENSVHQAKVRITRKIKEAVAELNEAFG
jgi:RNA polymerase sigma-70 factor, ECF subfamily